MTSPFDGPDGKARLCEALRDQRVLDCNSALVAEVAEKATLQRLEAGTDLVVQGDYGSDLFFLLRGPGVEILIDGNPVAARNAGEVIGEMAAVEPAGTRSATVRATGEIWVAQLDGAAFMDLASKYPAVLYKQIARMTANKLRERAKFLRPRAATPRLFIGCAAEDLPVAQAVQRGLDHDSIEVKVWTDGIFVPSSTTIEDLEACLDQFDFGLFILNGVDEITSREATSRVPRDNVILEFGMFVGRLKRERVFGLEMRGAAARRATDLNGVTMLDYDPDRSLEASIAVVCGRLRKRVAELGPR